MLDRPGFDRLLNSPQVRILLQDLLIEGDLQRTFPEVHALVGFGGADQGHKDLWEHTKQVVYQCSTEVITRWAALFHDVGKIHCLKRTESGISFHHHEVVSAKLFRQAAARTKFFSVIETKRIACLIEYLGYVESYDSSWTDSAIRRLRHTVQDSFIGLIDLARADITTRYESKRQAHHRRIQELYDRSEAIRRSDAVKPMLPTGLGTAIIQNLGIQPSPALGKILASLKEAVQAGDLPWPPTITQAIEYTRSCILPASSPPATLETLPSTEDPLIL